MCMPVHVEGFILRRNTDPRSQARLGRWTGCEKEFKKELFGICCVLCLGRGGEPPSVREKATAHTRTTMAVPVVCVERAVFRSLSSGGVINKAFRTSHRAASYKPKAPRTLRLQCIWLDSERYVGTLLPARSEAARKREAPSQDLSMDLRVAPHVCALHDVSPRDRWLCLLPGGQMNVNVNVND